MMKNIRENFPNIYIVIVGLCVAAWFRGVNMIISNVINEENIQIGLILILVSMLILYLDDNSISELRNLSNNAAAINFK